MHAHEIPTHLQVEDRLLAGLTVRQLLPMAVAAALSYWLWRHTTLPLPPRALLCAVTVAVGLACGLVRPGGEALWIWLGYVTAYALGPRRTLWQRAPEPFQERAASAQPEYRRGRLPRVQAGRSSGRGGTP